MSKFLSCAETAKLIRKALAEAFPGVKFSVRSSTYSMGASIRVHYTDGPSKALVEPIAKTFAGAGFDGMVDLKYYERNMVAGEEVHFGADFVFVEREYSDAAVERAIDAVFREYAGNLRGMARPSVEDFRRGRLLSVFPAGFDGVHWTLSSLIGRRLAKVSDRLAAGKSPTAASVIYLGNDHEGPRSLAHVVESLGSAA